MWPRIMNILIGIWLMAAPAVLDYAGIASQNDRIVGPIAASLATIAIWETTRPLRWVNLLLGLWLLVAPLVLGYEVLVAIFNSVLAGLFMIGFALIRGRIKAQFGGGWSVLWKSSPSERSSR